MRECVTKTGRPCNGSGESGIHCACTGPTDGDNMEQEEVVECGGGGGQDGEGEAGNESVADGDGIGSSMDGEFLDGVVEAGEWRRSVGHGSVTVFFG